MFGRIAGRRPRLTVGAALVALGLALAGTQASGSARGAGPETEPLEVDFSAAAPSIGVEVLRLPWGEAAGCVGRALPAEGLARGPEDFVIKPDGRAAVLDSVNQRLLLLGPPDDAGNRPTREIELGLSDPRFLAESAGRLYVLDSDADCRLVAVDWHGREQGELELPVFPEPVTGVFARGTQLFVELGHGAVYELPGDVTSGGLRAEAVPAGESASRPEGSSEEQPRPSFAQWVRQCREVPGRPTSDPGVGFQARYNRGGPAEIRLERAGREPIEIAVQFEPTADHLVSLDAAGSGLTPSPGSGWDAAPGSGSDAAPGSTTLLVGARLPHHHTPAPPHSSQAPSNPSAETPADLIAIARIETAGAAKLTGQLLLEVPAGPYLGEPYRIGADGTVYQPVATEDAFVVLRHTFQETPLSSEREEAQ